VIGQKPSQPDVDGNLLYRRAVIANANVINEIDSTETTLLYNVTAYLAHLLLRETQPTTHVKAKEPNSLAHFL